MKQILLTCSFFLTFASSFAQEDYSVKPWKDHGEKIKDSIIIGSNGALLYAPQIIFEEAYRNESKDFDSTQLFRIKTAKDEYLKLGQPDLNLFTHAQNDLKKRLRRIQSLNSEQKESIEKILKCYDASLSFEGYKEQVAKILKEESVDASYAFLFPSNLTAFLKKKNPDSSDYSFQLDAWKRKDAQINYSLVFNSESGTMLRDWYVESLKEWNEFILNSDSLNGNIAKIIEQKSYIDAMFKSYMGKCTKKDSAEVSVDDIPILEAYNEQLNKHKDLVKNLDNYWKARWIWYESDLTKIPGVEEYNSELKKQETALNAQIKVYDSLINAGAMGDGATLGSYDALSMRYAELMKAKEKLDKDLKKEAELKAGHANLNDSLFSQKHVHYAGILFLSDRCDLHFMRNHDFKSDYDLMDNQRNAYYNNESIHFLVHNTTGKLDKVKLEMKGVAIENHSIGWVDDVNATLDELNTVKGAEGLEGILELANLAYIKNAKIHSNRGEYKLIPCDSLHALYQRFNKAYDEITIDSSYLASYRTVKAKFNKKQATSWSTIEVDRKSGHIKLPATISYAFNKYKSRTEVAEAYTFDNAYKQYKLKYVQVNAGIAYSLNNPQYLEVTEDSGELSSEIKSDPLQFVAGIKIYPWGGQLDDMRFFRASKHNWHINASVSIPKPLHNFYLGIGYDIVPGWDISLNAQWYRDNRYEIENGQIASKSYFYRFAPAVSMSVDASVFVKAVKFFLK